MSGCSTTKLRLAPKRKENVIDLQLVTKTLKAYSGMELVQYLPALHLVVKTLLLVKATHVLSCLPADIENTTRVPMGDDLSYNEWFPKCI